MAENFLSAMFARYWSRFVARQLLKAEEWESAVIAYEEALKLDPENAWLWGGKGDALKQIGRTDEAQTCWHKCIKYHKEAVKRLKQQFPIL